MGSGPRRGQGLLVQGNYDGHLNASGRLVASNYYACNPSPAPLPGGTNDAQQFESLELKNISADATLDPTEVRFTDGIGFNFTGSIVPMTDPLAAGSRRFYRIRVL